MIKTNDLNKDEIIRKNMIKITNEVLLRISKLEYVLPETYNKIFLEVGLDLKINIDYLDIIDKSTNIYNQIQVLEKNTSAAIVAIEEKDLIELEKIKNEVKILRKEVIILKEDIFQDSLTNTYNRKYLIQKILTEKNDFINSGVLAIVDLNNLKYINDNIGHNIGDKIIIILSNELKKISNEVIRYGGDEFLLFFKDQNDLEKINKIFIAIRKKLFLKTKKANNVKFKISFSFGLINYQKDDWFEPILEQVDKKMYVDKIKFKKENN